MYKILLEKLAVVIRLLNFNHVYDTQNIMLLFNNIFEKYQFKIHITLNVI